jgi:CRP-like cAMP-binding protein
MHFKQADIFKGLEKGFVARMMEIGVKSTYASGATLFSQGDRADQFYILVKGRISLHIGENRNSTYTVSHGGEAFGWSALVGGQAYTATAKCVDTATLFAFNYDQVRMIMTDDPHNAALFYKNLALTLGNRLMLITSNLTGHISVSDNISFGTGQVQETAEIV